MRSMQWLFFGSFLATKTAPLSGSWWYFAKYIIPFCEDEPEERAGRIGLVLYCRRR